MKKIVYESENNFEDYWEYFLQEAETFSHQDNIFGELDVSLQDSLDEGAMEAVRDYLISRKEEIRANFISNMVRSYYNEAV